MPDDIEFAAQCGLAPYQDAIDADLQLLPMLKENGAIESETFTTFYRDSNSSKLVIGENKELDDFVFAATPPSPQAW